jgi:TetR/AcrR family transcriptional regulator, tetracycline repressor protein
METRSLPGKNRDRVRQPLSRDRIVKAALDLIESSDTPDLSMRTLGNRLGVEAMSLYRYLPSKAALLDAVVEKVLADVTSPDPADPDWRSQVLASARSFRDAIATHPAVVPLIQKRSTRSPKLREVWRASHDVWESAGADPYTANQLQLAVGAYVIGAPLWEASLGPRATDQGSGDPSSTFVRTAEKLRRELAFELGLGLLLDGIESELKRRAADPAPTPVELAS